MHSSRMRTGLLIDHMPESAWSRRGPGSDPPQGGSAPWVWCLDLIPLNSGPPLGCGPGTHPPQFPPWVWTWILIPLNVPPMGDKTGSLIPLNFPLGCGPRGGCLLLGVSLAGGSPWQGGLILGGSHLAGGPPWWGVPPSWGFFLLGGVSLEGGPPSWGLSEADPPVDRIIDTSKNITLATTSLRPVTKITFPLPPPKILGSLKVWL